MITIEEACKIAYQDRLKGMKITRIKDTGDSYIICYVTEKGEILTTQPYRISKIDGKRLPFALPNMEFFAMIDNAVDVEVPEQYKYKGGD